MPSAHGGCFFYLFLGMFSGMHRVLASLLLTCGLLVLAAPDLNGQRKRGPEDELVQFSGMVRDLQHRALPNVNIIILNDRRGTTSDKGGCSPLLCIPMIPSCSVTWDIKGPSM